ncbi:PqqD family peptide modification chaperone [Sinomonas sp. JGH33]|uniref:PqqD family peptide modification chaperone n=1 Tax=Sinomonas terricola TaxID=3110330 RepID=A0ABU5T3G1_9MICC|nr:PqqD family peptide modification chaperone [Sinomonas sp. JGH33]MEA5453666.1 PqqD family peptide modification chaperone [Sinomonas sp. JGH33]
MPIWRKCAHIAEVSIEDEGRVALLNLEAERPVVLTGSAAIIWGLIDGIRTDADILAELRDIFVYTADGGAGNAGGAGTAADDGAAEMARQLAEFLAQLERQGFAEAIA